MADQFIINVFLLVLQIYGNMMKRVFTVVSQTHMTACVLFSRHMHYLSSLLFNALVSAVAAVVVFLSHRHSILKSAGSFSKTQQFGCREKWYNL